MDGAFLMKLPKAILCLMRLVLQRPRCNKRYYCVLIFIPCFLSCYWYRRLFISPLLK